MNMETQKNKKQTSHKFSLRYFLGGDVLANDFFRRQTGLFILIIIYVLLYIGNRYAFQQEMREIEQLKRTLTDIQYKALTRSSELSNKSRQSRIEDYVKEWNSELQTSTKPPFLVK